MRYFLRAVLPPALPQGEQEPLGQNDEAILVSLAAPHQQTRDALRVDVVRLEMGDFLGAEPRAVTEHEGRAILQAGRRFHDGLDLAPG